MTVNEAVKLLKGWTEYGNKGKDVWREVLLTDTEGEIIAKMLLDMENEIALLKCCANCKYWQETYAACEHPNKAGLNKIWFAERTDTCSMWESEL